MNTNKNKHPNYNYNNRQIKNAKKVAKKCFQIVNDNMGAPVFALKESGRKVLYYRKEDEPYRFLLVTNYQRHILSLIDEYTIDDCDYKKLGYKRAYEVAYNTSIPQLYYEIYKTEQLLETMMEDKELYEYDIAYYINYKIGIENAIEIQKKYGRAFASIKNAFHIYVFNYSDIPIELDENKGHFKIKEEIGSCVIHLCDNCENIPNKLSDNDIVVVIKYSSANNEDIFNYIDATDSHLIFLDPQPTSKKRNKVAIKQRSIENLVRNHFSFSFESDESPIA